MPQNKTSFAKINFTILFIAFTSLILYSSCSKEDNVDDDDIQIEIGEYDPIYINSFWEYKNARIHYNDVANNNLPDSTTTYSYYRKTALRDTIIDQKKQIIILTEYFEDENFQVLSSSSNAYHYFENGSYYVNNQKYLDMNLDIGESWNSDTTFSQYPGGIIQNYQSNTLVNKNISTLINDQVYSNVAIISSCNYFKLQGQDNFYCEFPENKYYAKDIGLIYYGFCPLFQCTLTDLLNYQIEN